MLARLEVRVGREQQRGKVKGKERESVYEGELVAWMVSLVGGLMDR